MTPQRAADVCDSETRCLLEDCFEVTWGGPELGAGKLADLVADSDVVLTSWGTPHLDAAIWTGGHGPSVVAHAAGSVKKLVDPVIVDHGVAIFSAGGRIAWSVGEYCLAAMLTLARRLPPFDTSMRAGEWKPGHLRGHEITGCSVGILGASSTARALITLLKPFGCDVVVYDPYLHADRAAALGVRRATLEETLQCSVVSVHVPDVSETRGLVSRKLIEQLPGNAIVVNSSRGPAVDQEALLEQVMAGRLFAALDVFDAEPPRLAADVLTAPNLLLTPHIAGDTVEGHLALAGYVMADVIGRNEQPLRTPVAARPPSADHLSRSRRERCSSATEAQDRCSPRTGSPRRHPPSRRIGTHSSLRWVTRSPEKGPAQTVAPTKPKPCSPRPAPQHPGPPPRRTPRSSRTSSTQWRKAVLLS
jgi:phosphoglycerate dehydrogenase-like enzyme